MEPGTPAPGSGVYRDLYSGCEAHVRQGDPLPVGPGPEAKWFLVHAIDDSWMLVE